MSDDRMGVLLTAYADGSLPEEGCAFVEQQLEQHPELRDRLGEIRATQELLRASLPAAPERLSDAGRTAVLAVAERRPPPRFTAWRPLVLLAAACFVVAILAVVATPNLLESRVRAGGGGMWRNPFGGGPVIEQLNAGGESSCEPPPVRLSAVPAASAPAPAERGQAAMSREQLASAASSDLSGFVGGMPAPSAVRQRNGELTHVTEIGGTGVANGLSVKLAEAEDALDGVAVAKASRQAAPAAAPAPATATTPAPIATFHGPALDIAEEVAAAEQEADSSVPKGREEAVADNETGKWKKLDLLAGKRRRADDGRVQVPQQERKDAANRANQQFPRVYDAVTAAPAKPQRQLAMKAMQQAIDGKAYAYTEGRRGVERIERQQDLAKLANQIDEAMATTTLSFVPQTPADLREQLGSRLMDMSLRLQAGGTPLATGLLQALSLDSGEGVVEVPFRLLVDPNLPLRNRTAPQHGPPGVAVLHLCTANALQVVPMPGGFEIQAMRRPLDPTATFGWSRADLRDIFGSAPMQPVAEDAQQTFAIDASTSSFVAARAALTAGRLPDPAQIEPQHLYNAVPADYPAPTGDDAFQLFAEAGPAPFASGPLASRTALVSVGVVSRRAAEGERVPLDLVVALDASGSMGRPGGLDRARAGLGSLLQQLDARDRVAVVAFGDVARVVLPAQTGDRRDQLSNAINAVKTGGSTNLADGLALAYQVAGELATPGRTCRVALVTDGAALAGDAAPAAEAAVARWRGHGVSLLVVGCAEEAYDGAALERLAQTGDGEHHVVTSDEGARELFTSRLLPARLTILARDAKAQVTWNPERVAHARLIGFEKRRLTHEQFRDNSVDAGELAQDAQATALFEIVLTDRGGGPLGSAAVRYHDTRLDRVVELSRPLPGGLVAATASPRLRLLACAAEFGEMLQCGWWRNVRGPSDGRLAAELARLDAPFARELADLERRFRALEQDQKP